MQTIKDRVSKDEWQTRVDLAACYRLVAQYEWDDLVFTHITAKIPGADNQFLINPYGMMFEEITASSVVLSSVYNFSQCLPRRWINTPPSLTNVGEGRDGGVPASGIAPIPSFPRRRVKG